MMGRRWLVLGVLAIGLLFASTALAQSTPSIPWWAFDSGGGAATVDGVSLSGGVGQWVVARSTSGTTRLSAGFWSGAGFDEFEVMPRHCCKGFLVRYFVEGSHRL